MKMYCNSLKKKEMAKKRKKILKFNNNQANAS